LIENLALRQQVAALKRERPRPVLDRTFRTPSLVKYAISFAAETVCYATDGNTTHLRQVTILAENCTTSEFPFRTRSHLQRKNTDLLRSGLRNVSSMMWIAVVRE
jgi:hypothetical protein